MILNSSQKNIIVNLIKILYSHPEENKTGVVVLKKFDNSFSEEPCRVQIMTLFSETPQGYGVRFNGLPEVVRAGPRAATLCARACNSQLNEALVRPDGNRQEAEADGKTKE
ncbi:hypothetical protein E2C01_033069 [Portunus trituberculatus]|uniref:Uncharacterized protein n=1 Tax=Portunus trituberculatus TaxID=210409 RepID=A0A5B7EWV5_PORTR|nr:hypothetical protein [Portunus trituberculatus]